MRNNIPVTVILTSCNRFDLLERTLESFFRINSYQNIRAFHVHNDDTKREDAEKFVLLADKFPQVTWHLSNRKLGLSASLDYLLSKVKTKYVFTCEDDWEFLGNPNFIQDSLTIMEHYPNVKQVWIRDEKDHEHPLQQPASDIQGVAIKQVTKGYKGHWGGFSFNPGLRRVDDIRQQFPHGFSEYREEERCSRHAEKLGYLAVSLVNFSIRHIGWDRHTDNFIH